MRMALMIVGVLLLVCGGIFFLQGINIIPGSFMTGQTKWAMYGGVMVVLGIASIFASRRAV